MTDPFVLRVQWLCEHYPAGEDSRVQALLRLESAPGVEVRTTRIESHLVLILDISGSMNVPDKYPLLREALEMLMKNLEDGLFLTVIVFSGDAETLCKAVPAAEARARVQDVLAEMDSTPIRFQSTCLAHGLDLAMQAVQDFRAIRDDVVPRIYVLTDGQLTDATESFARAEDLDALHCEVHSFGFGNDFASESMRRIMGNCHGGTLMQIRNTVLPALPWVDWRAGRNSQRTPNETYALNSSKQ